MSRVSESRLHHAAAALSIGCALAAGLAHAAAPACANGVCTLDVEPKADAEPCANAPILLAWRQAGGAVLVQCETDDADMEQPSVVVDRRKPGGPSLDLQGVRFFDAASLPSLASGGVPDKFADHPLCVAPKPARVADGDLLLLKKLPSGNEKNPYCYAALRVSTTGDGLATQGDGRFTPPALKPHPRWDKLAARMIALIPAPASSPAAPAAGADTARVVHAKAPLRDAPDLAVAPHGYLVQGDAVTLLERSHAADGWVKARYVGKNGHAIERWLRADDLGLAEPAAAAH